MAAKEIKIPDLEGAQDVAVVEVYVSEGDAVEKESPLISLESDKAVMDVPSPFAGTITELKIGEGDTVNAGDVIALAEVGEASKEESAAPDENGASDSPEKREAAPEHPPAADDSAASEKAAGESEKESPAGPAAPSSPDAASPAPTGTPAGPDRTSSASAPVNAQSFGGTFHATPSVRALARELGVDLASVEGSGPKGRITREDVSALVKSVMSGASAGAPAGPGSPGAAFSLPPIPSADYAAFGEIETEDLSRIKKISGPHLHRNWLGIPHVTQFEDADITELEAFRKEINAESERKGGPKVSPLIFAMKAVVSALERFPDFNGSLSPDGASVIRKKYVNIGIAVDTPGGLVVPVVKNADGKGIFELAGELADLSSRAREGKLKSDEMKGATFTISSLGGIGGTYFTPIVNAPEVAILGLSRSAMKPVWNGNEFVPRLILPLSVSYDHRVIDGAQGARFAAYLASVLGDLRRTLL